jgi:hypothetical protein
VPIKYVKKEKPKIDTDTIPRVPNLLMNRPAGICVMASPGKKTHQRSGLEIGKPKFFGYQRQDDADVCSIGEIYEIKGNSQNNPPIAAHPL